MAQRYEYDAVVVGAGPNGFSAAITLARAGCSVLLLEAGRTPGGGVRSAEWTLPGFVHDVCSAIFPVGVGSPFFRSLPLSDLGVKWVHPPAPLAHPFDDGTAALLERSIEKTGETLSPDGGRYRRLMEPLAANWETLVAEVLRPLHISAHPWALAQFGVRAVWPAGVFARSWFKGERARALFAGMAAHAILPLEYPLTASFGVFIGMLGHAVGWPLVEGGSGRFIDALATCARSLKVELRTGYRVRSLDEAPRARMILLDVTPRQLVEIAGGRLPPRYRGRLDRYRYGPGAFKLDWALDGPIPWKAPECGRAATVHLGGTLEEIAESERAAWRGVPAVNPYVLLAQPSLFDPSRAPPGKHTAWAYCHVPNGSDIDMTERIETQIERFAPGFRKRILARHVMTPAAFEEHNANYIGGDIVGGAQSPGQLFTRPVLRWDPYSTPIPGVYLCSSSTPPGGGVHGMCGYYAARSALRREGAGP